MNRTTTIRRAALTGLAAVGLVVLGTTTASAHVTITPSTTAAGAAATLRVEIPHGCEDSATTAISVRVPAEATDVTASGTDRWAVEQTSDALTWSTDEPLPDGEHAEVEFSVRLPDDAGATLVFPVVQQCEVGEAAWTEVAEHGEGHDALERPAPVLVVTADEEEPAAEPAAEATETATAEPAAEAPAEPIAEPAAEPAVEARGSLVTYGAAGLLAAGVLVGGAVLLRQRRRG